MTTLTRRRALEIGTAMITSGAVSGCLGASSGNDTESQTTVRTSFFVLTDFARNVTEDATTVESLVPIGQHGHGWEPSAQVQRDALQSDALVYMGEGFQPWADKMVENVKSERPESTIIEARHDIDLLSPPSHEEKQSKHHEEEGGHNENHGDETDSGTDEGNHDHGTDEEKHNHGTSDPHFWLDPQRAKEAVTTIEDGLSKVDGLSDDVLAENATNYRNQLDELDAKFQSELESRKQGTVLVAGHNAFQYLGERYDFEIHALTGLAPDASPSPADVRRAQKLVEEHGIEHILAPVFESNRAAKQLVSETNAKDHLPVTPIPGVTEEWNKKGWGYIEIMERVNLPSLKTALGVK
ncbi:metal ABC transporter substrate-binding protein [Haladaptatus caseinilyticus]|uniref:metal ABC transporter substrate-binding protein n=1 Tax=Haladaptatus caseinilyticus TaxID=2993314 RepID=UPI00224A9289|nr:metal ABC transporter substrate-binding protein [Haladaptatus caseinilyticus]